MMRELEAYRQQVVREVLTPEYFGRLADIALRQGSERKKLLPRIGSMSELRRYFRGKFDMGVILTSDRDRDDKENGPGTGRKTANLEERAMRAPDGDLRMFITSAAPTILPETNFQRRFGADCCDVAMLKLVQIPPIKRLNFLDGVVQSQIDHHLSHRAAAQASYFGLETNTELRGRIVPQISNRSFTLATDVMTQLGGTPLLKPGSDGVTDEDGLIKLLTERFGEKSKYVNGDGLLPMSVKVGIAARSLVVEELMKSTPTMSRGALGMLGTATVDYLMRPLTDFQIKRYVDSCDLAVLLSVNSGILHEHEIIKDNIVSIFHYQDDESQILYGSLSHSDLMKYLLGFPEEVFELLTALDKMIRDFSLQGKGNYTDQVNQMILECFPKNYESLAVSGSPYPFGRWVQKYFTEPRHIRNIRSTLELVNFFDILGPMPPPINNKGQDDQE